ncbi:MAG: AzlC family ABC transporter permease [Spirochaetales bacterium]|jgi:4-azaleucine resistance transporter AzlC|nr:AzlC family ABC transporter permease [Spirochaetales bacterium]
MKNHENPNTQGSGPAGKSLLRQALISAFPRTAPVLTGYIFLGIAFGILLASKGYGVLWALGMSVTVFAGSLQFVGAGLLAGGFHPLQAALITLMVNARHIFYGLSLLESFHGLRKTKFYMIFALTDETFSLLCTPPPAHVDKNLFRLCVAILDHLYWITGSVIGSLMGRALPFNPRGIDFVMTALFTVIFLEQWRTRRGRRPALLGIAAAALCLFVFGSRWFLIPAMALIFTVLAAAWLSGRKRHPAVQKDVA